jgi:hypothetical protein
LEKEFEMKKYLFVVISFLVLNASLALSQSVSLSTNAVYQTGSTQLTLYWSGFSGNVNLKFYKGGTFITYANTNVSGSGNQVL